MGEVGTFLWEARNLIDDARDSLYQNCEDCQNAALCVCDRHESLRTTLNHLLDGAREAMHAANKLEV